jgi:acyl carrier protein
MTVSLAVSSKPADSNQSRIAAWSVNYIAKAIDVDPATINPNDEIDNLGLDSAMVTAMVIDMESWLGIEIPISIFFEYRTLNAVAAEVAKLQS